MLAVRLGQDDEWAWAELRGSELPVGRPRQLALRLSGVGLPDARPVRAKGGPRTRCDVPAWLRARWPEPVRDDPALCPPQVPGQLGLFPTLPRTFAATDGARLHDRDIPDLSRVFAELERMARQREVGSYWLIRTRPLARLALAAREPGEHTVRAEALRDLPALRPTIGEALRRAGLLAGPASRRIVAPGQLTHGSCEHCLAWANDRRRLCTSCANWQLPSLHPDRGACSRCHRFLPIADGMCRFCKIVTAESKVDAAGAAMSGGDQLWFAGRLAPALAVVHSGRTDASHGRFDLKRRLARAAADDPAPSPHQIDPVQLELFPTPDRDWSRLTGTTAPGLTPEAAAMVDDFTAYIRSRGWSTEAFSGTVRTLRVITGHLGASAPVYEADVRALASLHPNLHGHRLLQYLRDRDLLVPLPRTTSTLVARARRTAAALPGDFAPAAQRWIDVLQGQGNKESWARTPKTIDNYLDAAAPVLTAWHAAGLHGPREVTKEHIEAALEPLASDHARRVHPAVRSFFRALRRERLVFRDPARAVSLTAARPLPVNLPSDRLAGILDQLPDTRSRLIVALVAVHALFPHQVAHLRLADLNRSTARQRVRRPRRLDHVLYLDSLLMNLTTAWIRERHQRWPDSTNPYLIVSRQPAIDTTGPVISAGVLQKPFRTVRLTAQSLRTDRILDEARHSADPVRLMRLFGLANITATRYVFAAHPDKRPDPVRG
ncbi:hypothetical protein ACIRST_37760 [Kitasatospora sp. NPDC101447]|uniref:hypothetical protein n=1 Tax=Kitasatospora sp. NPDC101447 TaxID=3364102 RepID=UPI0038309878